MNTISEERMMKSLSRLLETDEQHARLSTAVEAAVYSYKEIKSQAYLQANGTIDERKAYAETSGATKQARQDHLDAILDYKLLEAKRKSDDLVIQLWRSLNRNRRDGQI